LRQAVYSHVILQIFVNKLCLKNHAHQQFGTMQWYQYSAMHESFPSAKKVWKGHLVPIHTTRTA